MLSYQDCVDFSGLTDDEVEVLAEHRQIPAIVAAELGSTLLQNAKGIFLLKQYMLETLEHAKLTGHLEKARRIDRVYVRFNARYPTRRVL